MAFYLFFIYFYLFLSLLNSANTNETPLLRHHITELPESSNTMEMNPIEDHNIVNSNNEMISCIFCEKNILMNNDIEMNRIIKCNSNEHAFHIMCILPWIASGKNCPLCRTTFPRLTIHQLNTVMKDLNDMFQVEKDSDNNNLTDEEIIDIGYGISLFLLRTKPNERKHVENEFHPFVQHIYEVLHRMNNNKESIQYLDGIAKICLAILTVIDENIFPSTSENDANLIIMEFKEVLTTQANNIQIKQSEFSLTINDFISSLTNEQHSLEEKFKIWTLFMSTFESFLKLMDDDYFIQKNIINLEHLPKSKLISLVDFHMHVQNHYDVTKTKICPIAAQIFQSGYTYIYNNLNKLEKDVQSLSLRASPALNRCKFYPETLSQLQNIYNIWKQINEERNELCNQYDYLLKNLGFIQCLNECDLSNQELNQIEKVEVTYMCRSTKYPESVNIFQRIENYLKNNME